MRWMDGRPRREIELSHLDEPQPNLEPFLALVIAPLLALLHLILTKDAHDEARTVRGTVVERPREETRLDFDWLRAARRVRGVERVAVGLLGRVEEERMIRVGRRQEVRTGERRRVGERGESNKGGRERRARVSQPSSLTEARGSCKLKHEIAS